MTYIGGRRARLIHASFFYMVQSGLQARGWLTSAGKAYSPITLIAHAVVRDTEIPVNTLAIAASNVHSDYLELGSLLEEERWTFYIDFYAENEALGEDVIHDVRDILRGKIPSIGRSRPVLDVIDYSAATPTTIFHADIENVIMDKAVSTSREWQNHWYVIRCDVIDAYTDELDP